MNGHVLNRELELDGQMPKLHHLAHAHAYWDRPDVPRSTIKVGQDITRLADIPAFAEEDRCDRLQVKLVSVRLSVLATNRPPLLGKDTQDKIFRQVAY